MFSELVQEVIKRIMVIEGQARIRNSEEQLCFERAVHSMLVDLWQSVACMPGRECVINIQSSYDFENSKYLASLLSYQQAMAAFNGLLKLGFVEIIEDCYSDHEIHQVQMTRFVARNELLEKLIGLEGHPAISVHSDLELELIIMQNNIGGRRILQDYEVSSASEMYKSNLQKINLCFLKHWCDLEITNREIPMLEARIENDKTKQPIDLSQRTLVRMFANGSFREGGKFYRGWWQNVPSEYRKYITIDALRTAEFDFSQLDPHLLYFANYKELGSEDAYDRVLEGDHREVVKQAFNAMVYAPSILNDCPVDVDLSEVALNWTELRDRIIATHKPISDLFFTGAGSHLQFQNSCITERIMMHFAALDAPALPVHDNFILHYSYAQTGEVEEALRRAFFDELYGHITKGDTEILSWSCRKDGEDVSAVKSLAAGITENVDDGLSLWRSRHNVWHERNVSC